MTRVDPEIYHNKWDQKLGFIFISFIITYAVSNNFSWVCLSVCLSVCMSVQMITFEPLKIGTSFLGGLSLHLNHLIGSRVTNYDWPFETLPFGIFVSNLDTRDLETYPRTYSGHFWNMSLFDDSRAVWVLFRKWVVSENQSFLNEGAIITPLLV